MYLQLTTRCNMECAHCCFSATKRGDDMTEEIFSAALDLCEQTTQWVVLGGGEPTVHPKFKRWLLLALEYKEVNRMLDNVTVITNGKRTSVAHWLLDLVTEKERDVVVELSLDPYHDPINPFVEERWKRMANHGRERRYYGWYEGAPRGYVGIRSAGTKVSPWGRAIESGLAVPQAGKDECCCEDLFVDPQGFIYPCGCKKTKLGHVLDAPDLSWYVSDYGHKTGGVQPFIEVGN